MSNYVIANPFPHINHGITNYAASAYSVLKKNDVLVELLNCQTAFQKDEFEHYILNQCKGKIVEIPDSHGMFSQGSDDLSVHVRLHAPILQLERLNQKKLSIERFAREKSTIEKAKYVSSPTYENAKAYGALGVNKIEDFLVFANPLDITINTNIDKDIDVIFIGRCERLKGVDLLHQILAHLPSNLKVAILGVKEEQANYFNSPLIQCQLDIPGWVDNTVKAHYLSRSKVCIMLSRFESYSMVTAEAIASGCNVLAWNIGGTPEAFPAPFVKYITPFDVRMMSASIIASLDDQFINSNEISDFIDLNNENYVSGIRSIINDNKKLFSIKNIKVERSDTYYADSYYVTEVTNNIFDKFNQLDLRLLGICMNSESVENMWGCFLNNIFKNHKFYSRHPLGTRRKEGFSKIFDIDSNNYEVVDWHKNVNDIIKNVKDKNNDVLMIFNGNTKFYRQLISRLYDHTYLVPVYSELGWFPQSDHIYFDIKGANSQSLLAEQNLESLVGKISFGENVSKTIVNKSVLLALQLPGDTTLYPESYPAQLSNQDLIKYVRKSIPDDYLLVVRQHPSDKTEYEIHNLINTEMDITANFSDSISKVCGLVAVNSTVVLEAMKYDINIYTLGYGVFSGKDLTIDCSRGNLAKNWREVIEYFPKKRQLFLDYLIKRQLNVVAYNEDFNSKRFAEAVYPIFLSYLIRESNIGLSIKSGLPKWYVKKEKKVNLGNNTYYNNKLKELESSIVELQIRMNNFEKNRFMNKLKRKTKKFFKNPVLFFKDMRKRR